MQDTQGAGAHTMQEGNLGPTTTIKDAKDWRLLAEASSVLSSSLDYSTTLQNLAQLIVPRYADWCSVDLLEGGVLVPVALRHVDPAKIAFAQEYIQRFQGQENLRKQKDQGVYHVLRTGIPEVYPNVTEKMLAESADNIEEFELLKSLGFSSVMVIPLVARGRSLGVITFIWSDSKKHYGEDDLVFAKSLGLRAGMAVDSARLYKEIQDANQAKNHFVAMLAHELRNPLAPILTSVQLLQASNPSEETQEALEVIERQVGNMTRLLNDLLDISRIVQGKITLQKQSCDLHIIVKRAIEMAKPEIDCHHHTLNFTSAESEVRIYADPLRIEQVVVNLLNNAAKYMQDSGSISLYIGIEEQDAILRIRDAGIGISSEMLPRVFDLFSQADHNLAHTSGGLGVGLAVVKNIVEMHGGTVTVSSKGLEKGSEFIVRLPLIITDGNNY